MALTETPHAGSFLLSEANGTISRENVTLLSGEDLEAGTVVGKITATSKYAAYDQQAGDGSEVAAGVLLAKGDASAGDLAVCIIARDAEVIADQLTWPDGSPTDITAGIADLKAIGIIVRDN